jgi:uncharacterized membrane protein
VLYLAIIILVLSITVFGLIWAIEEENSHENSNVATAIFDILHNEETISDDMKDEIVKVVDSTDQISKVQVFILRDVERKVEDYTSIFEYLEKAEPDYQYSRTVFSPKWLLVDFFPYGNGDVNWYVNMETRHIGSFMTLVLFVGAAVYATLFTIWATINAYHHKRLNIGWIIVFALFNVLGYLFYRFVGKWFKWS